MKRDARIGLAVVLVLGLAVTLLIGRALYRNTEVADSHADDGVEHSTPAAASGDEVRRVDGVREASAAAPSPTNPAQPDTSRAETVQLPTEQPNAAVRDFVEDQTRPIGNRDRFAGSPGTMTPETNARPTTSANNAHVAPTHGGPNPEDALGDHEGPTPHAENVPSEYGYTVGAGDNVWKISSKVYGDGKYTQKIVDANKDINMAKLKPGMIVKIPTITNKTILMKLPSFADAKSGKSSSESAIATKDTKKSDDRPIAAQKLVKAEVSEGPAESSTHKVAAGETLGAIAKSYYGTAGPKTIAKIVEANKGLDPARLKVGQEIVLPAKK